MNRSKYHLTGPRFPTVLFIVASFVFAVSCRPAADTDKARPNAGATSLTGPVFIRSSEGDEEIFAAGARLPATYSERFVSEENQDSAGITVSQSTSSGMEIIAEVDVPLPKEKEESSVVVTVRIDETHALFVKASVMETGLVKEFGPFPVK